MSLRTGAIEAIHAETETWGYKAGIYELLHDAHAELLDALLDYLEAHADEWFNAWTQWTDTEGDPKFIGLVAVLRGGP